MPDATVLTWGSGITVRKVKDWIAKADRNSIADFVGERFNERYFSPLIGRSVSGFLLMGVSCLVIETLESYRHGWQSSEGLSAKAFHEFFNRPTIFNQFKVVGDSFYKHVRCGILHQGETTGGWTVTQATEEPLLDIINKRVNAREFHAALLRVLGSYIEELKQKTIMDEIWINCLFKLQATIRNCDGQS